MNIYPKEIADGLESSLQSTGAISYASIACAYVPSEEQVERAKLLAAKSQGKSNLNQVDLYYLNSVLVSTGWNKNDDVFDISETWAARNTPEDKQFNFMHDESDIIGHITANVVTDFEGNIIGDDQDKIPEAFNIVTSAVLYNSWSDPELKERMERLIAEIEDGKWFVSMECLFNNFDYAVVSPEGNNQIVQRDEASAFLTKHLRAYGGNGEYEGYKVGRMLRNISFSGKGLVNNPANPRSVILPNTTDPFQNSKATLISDTNIKEINMSDDSLRTQVDELKAELAGAREAAESAKKEILAKQEEEVKAQVEAFEATISEKDEAAAALEAQLTEATEKTEALEAEVTQKQEELTEALAKIEAHEAEIKLAARKAALVEAGAEETDEIIEKFASADDEMFDEIVALLTAKWNGKKKNEEDDEEEKDEASVVETVSDEEIDEAEATADSLEEVEESDEEIALADTVEDDSVVSARATASEWLESNVLRSTANLDNN
jgi:hypothetical protein